MFYYTERDVRCKMMAEGKIIDVAVKKTSHSIYLPKQSHQTKSQEFPEHFHSFTDIIFQFKFRLWLSDLLNRAIDSDIKVLNHVLLTLASVGQIVGNYWPVKYTSRHKPGKIVKLSSWFLYRKL